MGALVGMGTFLCSKEYFVMEHDFFVGLGLFAVLGAVVKQVGPSWTEEINKELDEEEAQLKNIRQGEIADAKLLLKENLELSRMLQLMLTSLLPRKRLLVFSWRPLTELDFLRLTHRSRSVLITSLRQQMF